MYVFGEIDNSSTIIESNVVNYTQNLTTSSIGIKSIKIVSGSISESYWNSLNVLFYTSGSPQYLNEHKFGTPSSNISVKKKTGKQFLTKYHGYPSSSIIPIPSQYYGEKITEKSFKLTEVDVTDNSNNNPIIIDDGKGNLYSTNAHHSQSAGALSSYLLASEFTSSDWQPYITTINLYDRGNYEEPIIQAKLPRPIRKSDKINMRFKIKLDI